MLSIIAMLFALGVTVHAGVLPTVSLTDEVCPVTSVPLANFQPEKFFDGKVWYVVGGAPMGSVTCVSVIGTYDAKAKSVAFNETIKASGGQVIIVPGTFTQDASSNAVYHYVAAETTSVETILDTDYTSYGVYAQCQHGTFQGQTVLILSRTPGKPATYDALLKKLSDAGYDVDKIKDIDTSDCSN